jgi:hypothetical protein
MGIGGVARRPGLVLAACTWVAFAAMAAGPVQQAVALPNSISGKILFASRGFGDVPSVCLLIAAILLVVEHRAAPIDGATVPALAVIVVVSAAVTVVMAVASVVVVPIWSTSTPASAWAEVLAPCLTAGALAALAAVLAQPMMHG